MAQLFFRRHYETIERVLGAGYYHAKSRLAEQMIDLQVKMFCRVLQQDAPKSFNEALFKRGIQLHAHADDTKR